MRKSIYFKYILFLFFSFFIFAKSYSVIPQAAKDDARFKLGYLVVTYYSGVMNDGTGDSRPGIQEAIDDAFDNDLVVLFPPGTYIVSDVLKCYYWGFWDFDRNRESNPPNRKTYVLMGDNSGGNRPIIKLADNAPGFDNSEIPRPVIVWRYFSAENSNAITEVEPENPMSDDPPNYYNKPNVVFGWEFRNIDIDLNGHQGAVGGVFNGAQYSAVIDCEINATDAYCGILGVPGRNSVISNIKVVGGRYGIINNGDAAGACLVGAKLYNQTIYAITSMDFCPYSLVGVDIITGAPSAVFVTDKSWYSSGNSTISMVDCKIQMNNGGTAIDNLGGKSIHLSNVFVKGAENLISCGSEAQIKGNENWERIIEYTYNDQRNGNDKNLFETYSVINGEISQNAEPDTRIEQSEPPENLITRHLLDNLPYYSEDDTQTVNVKTEPYGAVGDGENDDWSAIQNAIDNSPNGHVFLPKGNYAISKPLVLKSNTKLFGLNQNFSYLVCNSLWSAGVNRAMVETVDYSGATTFFGFIGFNDQSTEASNASGGFVHWKAGRNSTLMMCRHMKTWGTYYGTHVRYNYHFSGNAGGRVIITPHSEEAASNINGRQVFIENTSQPLTFYGLNMECTKTRTTGDIVDLGTNLEIVNSSNIRIHSIKREGNSPTVLIKDSENVAIYGMGRLNVAVKEGLGAYNQISGNCNNILLSTIVLDNKREEVDFNVLEENITGIPKVEIPWPSNISIYKRGELSDIYNDSNTGITDINIPNNKIRFDCYPNPSREDVFMKINATEQCEARISISNLLGEKVPLFVNQILSPGVNYLYWNREEKTINIMKRGIFFIHLETTNYSISKKIILL